MSTLGIIFSDIDSRNISELTAKRTVASIPFAGRYRIVDFALSNMVNSGIYNIGIVTKSNYQSLVDHIGSGKDWDLSRKNGGLTILPPYAISGDAGPYKGRLDALIRIKGYIENSNAEYVILSDCDFIFNIDYNEVIRAHKKNCADITAVYSQCEISNEHGTNSIVYDIDENGCIRDILLNPDVTGAQSVSLNTWVMSREYLLYMMANSASHGFKDFFRHILLDSLPDAKVLGYRHDGYSAHIQSLTGYLSANMDMIDRTNRSELFGVDGKPIHTKVRDSSPTKYGSEAVVKNSLIADGCVIEGTVENSILFRGVKVSRGSVVKNSILMQGTRVEDNASLSWVIADKHVIIRDNKVLSADKTYPFYIAKGKMI